MRVLQLHNEYRAYGGEDTVFDLERDLLTDHGHEVERLVVSNRKILKASLKTGLETVWSERSRRLVSEALKKVRPDILHVHNTFPRLSPSVYWAASSYGVPVVQSLHNYRLACVNGLLLRDDHACELCVGRTSWPGVMHRCYRDSAAASGAIAAMQTFHTAAGTFSRKVDAYITLTDFAKKVMLRSGLPEERVHVKPNFVPDPLPTKATFRDREDKVVFVGRLTAEKGLDLLLEAWSRLEAGGTRLIILGDGPDRVKLEREYGNLRNVEWRGWKKKEKVVDELRAARFLVVPSRAYEGFPMSVVEAMSTGTPVISPNHAGFPEIVSPGSTGFLFAPGDPSDLAEKLRRACKMNAAAWRKMSEAARSAYLERYTPEVNYARLIEIYESAVRNAARAKRAFRKE